MASSDPKIELIENGIQTVQFIQANRDEIQKTYGRSAISKPTTRERTAAWETHIELQGADAPRQGGGAESQDGSNQDGSSGGNRDNGQISNGDSVPDGVEGGPSDNRDHQGGDGENSSELNSGTGENSGREGNGADRGRDSNSQGADGPKGSNTDHEIDDYDYDRICILDQATEDHLAGREVAGKLEVREANPSDIAEILGEEGAKTHRRLRGIRNMSKSSESEDGDQSPVKKGIGENIASMSSRGRHTSDSGAILPAPRSQLHLYNKSVSADSARRVARTAREISSDDDITGFSSIANLDDLSDKLDKVLENQIQIIQKLTMVSEINEEIKGIKKILTNHGLTLSMLESYVNDLMIVIPKEGNPGSDSEAERNPDLRMVVGRDNSRGLPEVTRTRRQATQFGEELGRTTEIDPQYLQEPLNFSKNNAANFVPDEGPISQSIVFAMIKRKVKDDRLKEELMELVESSMDSMSMRDMYYQIKDYINQLD